MPTEILQLLGFDGPNLYGPQPGVFLRARSDKDRALRIKSALKDGAQSIGMVLAYLDVGSAPVRGPSEASAGYEIGAHFATPTPALGVELARYVVAGLNAREAGDESWDAEGPLWDLQKRRRAEALPLAVLQISAEAAARGIPTLLRHDGQVQIGYGARSWAFDAAQFAGSAGVRAPDESGVGAPVGADIHWERLGPIPIVAVAGGASRDIAAQLIAAAVAAQGQAARLAVAAGYDATLDLLADPAAAIAVVGLNGAGIAQRGLAFERCAFSAVTDLPAELPPQIADREELARALGVPMLITDPSGAVALNADIPEIVALAEYAPCPIIYVSTAAENTTVGFHRAAGGAALFVRKGDVIAANGAGEQAIMAATLPPSELPGPLAALALLWAMGMTWDQITQQRQS